MADKTIEIPDIDIQELVVEIVGTTPLLTNRMSEESINEIATAQNGAAKSGRAPRNPEAEFRAACHKIDDKTYGFPAIGIKKSMVQAGFRFVGEKSTELYGAINVIGSLLPIESPEPTMQRDYVVLHNGKGKKGSLAYRPCFTPWSIKVPIGFNAGILTQSKVLNLVRLAGFGVGIGSWRPECKGINGQFELGKIGELQRD